jgi:hypothetical protein
VTQAEKSGRDYSVKRCLRNAVVNLAALAICAYCNGEETHNSGISPGALPKNLGANILGVASAPEDSLVITTWEEQDVGETLVRVFSCDLTGQIRDVSEFVIHRVLLSLRGTEDPNCPVVWISSTGYHEPPELWLAERNHGKLQPKLLLKQGTQDNLSFQKCWLLEAGGRKKVFVQKYKFKKTRVKGELELTPTYWLYCYVLGDAGLKLKGRVLIGEGKTQSDEFSVECAVVNGEINVWVCEHLDKWRKSILRVAEWRNDGNLKWSQCYKGGDVSELLSIDRAHGSAVGIFEWKQNQPYSSAIICRLHGKSPECVNLGYGFGGKHQLLRVQKGAVNWLLLNYEVGNMRVHALDEKLQEVNRVEKSYRNAADLHLVRSNNQSCHIVLLMGDRIKIEKLEELPIAEPVPEDLVQRLSEEMIAEAYRGYIQGEGKKLVKATSRQLEQDITTAEEESAVISYYRLLSRNERLAKSALDERIRSVVREAVGEEHWLTNMELAFYGQPAVGPLLAIATTKAGEERQIALEALYSVPDSNVADQLTKLLVKPDVRKDVATCLMICDMGVRAGNEEAVDFLIKAATGKFKTKEEPEAEELMHESRRVLIEMTRAYQDTPEAWSEGEWSKWLKKHRDSIKPEAEAALEEVQRRKQLKYQHRLFQELAEMLEKK